MESASNERDLILAVIRGELPLDALREVGIELTIGPGIGGWNTATQNDHGVRVLVDASDFVQGLRTYMFNPAALREWSFAMLAGSFWEFDPMHETNSVHETILDALHAASFGEPLGYDALLLIQPPLHPETPG